MAASNTLAQLTGMAPWGAWPSMLWRLATPCVALVFPLATAAYGGIYWATWDDADDGSVYVLTLEGMRHCDDDISFCDSFFVGNGDTPLAQLPGGQALASASSTAYAVSVVSSIASILAIAWLLAAFFCCGATARMCACCVRTVPACSKADPSLLVWTVGAAIAFIALGGVGMYSTLNYNQTLNSWEVSSLPNITANAYDFGTWDGYGCAMSASIFAWLGGGTLALAAALETCERRWRSSAGGADPAQAPLMGTGAEKTALAHSLLPGAGAAGAAIATAPEAYVIVGDVHPDSASGGGAWYQPQPVMMAPGVAGGYVMAQQPGWGAPPAAVFGVAASGGGYQVAAGAAPLAAAAPASPVTKPRAGTGDDDPTAI